jgi:hypothetical protein
MFTEIYMLLNHAIIVIRDLNQLGSPIPEGRDLNQLGSPIPEGRDLNQLRSPIPEGSLRNR